MLLTGSALLGLSLAGPYMLSYPTLDLKLPVDAQAGMQSGAVCNSRVMTYSSSTVPV